jgi:hypothetical protein
MFTTLRFLGPLQGPLHHPPVFGAVAQWTVDVDLLVMGGQGWGVFSTGTSGSMTSSDNVGEGG